MSKKLYRDREQATLVLHGVKALLDLTTSYKRQISKETLQLICDRYCYVVDPPSEPGDSKYKEGSDD